MPALTDYITITLHNRQVWQAKCYIDHAEGEMPDETDATLSPAARVKVKLRYSPALDPVIATPGKYRAELARTSLPIGTIQSAIQDPRDRRCVMLEL